MPKVDRGALMQRAWMIFRKTYKYPQIKFKDIGRRCFAWALKKAWAEARETRRLAALSQTAKAERIQTLQALIARADFIDSGPQWKSTVASYRNEIQQLRAD